MKQVKDFPIRLREARRMMHLSMQQLSDRTGTKVSKQSISFYEQGRVSPKAAALAALADALDISEAYFNGTAVTLDVPALRKSIGIKDICDDELQALHARISFWAEQYAAAERRAALSQAADMPLPSATFTLPIPRRLVSTGEEAMLAATDVRRTWNMGTGPIPSILRLLERKGIAVMNDALPDSALGLSTWTNTDRPIIIVDMRREKTTVERLRFTAAHELAHLLLRFPEEMEEKQKEKLCDKFAGVFLLPPDTLKEELGTRRSRLVLDELTDLKQLYGVSVAALVHTAYDLQIIDRQQYDWWYDERINKNRKETGWGHYSFPETLGREKRIRAIGEEIAADVLNVIQIAET